jgi:plasmid stability protein
MTCFWCAFGGQIGVFALAGDIFDITDIVIAVQWIRMATLLIRNLDGEVKKKLRVRAAMNERSMEAEARAILTVIVNYVPIAEMPGPESAAPEKK